MALFKPIKTTNSSLSSLPIKEGQLVVTTDTKKLYFDKDASNRIEIQKTPTKVSELTNDSGYTTNIGTITQIKLNGTNVATSGVANIQAIPVNFGSASIGDKAGDIVEWSKYGTPLYNGVLTSGNILSLGVNRFYRCYERGSTTTCNYSDKVSGWAFFDGSYSGYYTSINPSTDFIEKPFILEVTKPTSYEMTDVSRLLLLGHRLGNTLNCRKYKIEVAYAYSNGTYSWDTVVDYDGPAINILGKYYGLYCSNQGTPSAPWHSIYGIRLTVSESTSTVLCLSEVQLITCRGTEQPYEALHVVPNQGGTYYGTVTAPTFVGALTGTATNAAKTTGALTVQKNGTQVGETFNGSANKTINISVPTKTSDLTNDSGYATQTYVDNCLLWNDGLE